jgi:osmotically-inducible protein OsmY
MKMALFLVICGIGLAGCDKSETSQTTTPAAPTVSTSDAAPTATTQPDNTGVNTRDRSNDAVTAASQGQGKSDVDVTADIRRRIMAGHMSVNAENVKVVSQNGKVTLRGPVDTQSEKDSIGQMATDVVGANNVDNQLDIKAGN